MVEIACGLLVVALVSLAALYQRQGQHSQAQTPPEEERPPLYW